MRYAYGLVPLPFQKQKQSAQFLAVPRRNRTVHAKATFAHAPRCGVVCNFSRLYALYCGGGGEENVFSDSPPDPSCTRASSQYYRAASRWPNAPHDFSRNPSPIFNSKRCVDEKLFHYLLQRLHDVGIRGCIVPLGVFLSLF